MSRSSLLVAGGGTKGMAYPTCSCGTQMLDREISVNRVIDGHVVTIADVPALVCPRCGMTLYRASAVKTMDALVRANPNPGVYAYPRAAPGVDVAHDLDEPIRVYDLIGIKNSFLRSLRGNQR